jgi:hypothetical protein
MAGDVGRATRRVADALRESDDPVATLGREVAGADLTSLLLEVMQRRAAAVNPADLVRAIGSRGLVEPGRVDARALHRTIATVLDALPPAYEVLELSPAAPLGTCSAIATVDQHKVAAAVRGIEIAGDPTNLLAVLVAARPPDAGPTRLAAVQRVLRVQPQGPGLQAHFTVLGLVVAGRDAGNLDFERTTLVELLAVIVGAVRAVTADPVELRITSLRDAYTEAIVADVRDAGLDAAVVSDPDRATGRGYYRDLCFKVMVGVGDDIVEVGDGGFTDWTQQLRGSRKERLLIGGLGVDRLATLASR